MSKDLHLPHYLRESVFRQYEHVIAEVVRKWPSVTIVDPVSYGLPKSILTCESRLRYAMKSLRDYGWDTAIIDKVAFMGIVLKNNGDVPSVGVRSDTKEKPVLLVGPEAEIRALKKPPVKTRLAPSPNQEALDLTGHDLNQLLLVFLLAQKRAINQPIKLSLTPDEVTEVESSYDIAFEPQSDGTYLLL